MLILLYNIAQPDRGTDLNFVLFGYRWSFSLFRRGFKHGLTVEDLWQARAGDHSGRLGDRLEQAWQEELDNAKRKGIKPSFSKAIVRSFWLEYLMCGLVVGLLFIFFW